MLYEHSNTSVKEMEETAHNFSGDIFFTVTAEYYNQKKNAQDKWLLIMSDAHFHAVAL